VRVTLNATDDMSGAVLTTYKTDADSEWTVARPGASFLIEGEGTHTLEFYSTDRVQNTEAVQSVVINIDLTPPEAVMSYDAASDQILVHATNALSGTYGGAVAPSSVAPTVWRAPAAANIAETRTYSLQDLAGNTLDLTMQVRRLGDEYELNVISLVYDPPSWPGRDASPAGQLQKNTVQFRWLMPGTCCGGGKKQKPEPECDVKCGCGDSRKGRCILAVLQRILVAKPRVARERNAVTPTRVLVEAEWSILYDEIIIKVGSLKDGTGVVTLSGDGSGWGGDGRDGGGTRCFKICGLWVLRILSVQGRLTIDLSGINKVSADDRSSAGGAVTAFMMK